MTQRSPAAFRRRVLLVTVLAAVAGLGWMVRPGWSLPPTGSPIEAIRLIAQRAVHGWLDDGKSSEQLSRIVESRPVFLSCGAMTVWAVDLLRAAGYDARLAMVLTRDPWNDTDNGHSVVEVRESHGWVAYDIDRHVWWTDEAGKGISVREWVRRVPTDDYRIALILSAVDDPELREQDHRFAHVPFILDEGVLYFPSGPDDERIMRYATTFRMAFQPLPETDWTARFYG